MLASKNHMKPRTVQARKVGKKPPRNNSWSRLFESTISKLLSSTTLMIRK